MDLMHMPVLWYITDFNRVNDTHLFGFIGVFVCLAACLICWYQIKTESNPYRD